MSDLLGTEKVYDDQEFKKITLRDERLVGKEFTDCVFTRCSFRDTAFQACKFQDCTFQNCEWILVTLKGCSFKNTRFEESQIVGVSWLDTNLSQTKPVFGKRVDFVKCEIHSSIFAGLNLKSMVMTQCVAKNVSFEDANLASANCTKTDFTECQFFHTDLTGADFTGAINYAISPNVNTLKKTKFSLPEAVSLLRGLDIVLVE